MEIDEDVDVVDVISRILCCPAIEFIPIAHQVGSFHHQTRYGVTLACGKGVGTVETKPNSTASRLG